MKEKTIIPGMKILGFPHHLSAQSLKVGSIADNMVDLVLKLQWLSNETQKKDMIPRASIQEEGELELERTINNQEIGVI